MTLGADRLSISYVCGALRVTTRDDSASTGPRAHVTGLIAGFEALGHRVLPMLAGDHVPARLSRTGDADPLTSGGSWRSRLVDGVRVGINPGLGVWTRRGSRGSDLFYERQATYQTLGEFRPRGTPWVVESNGPFWYEASKERQSLSYPGLAKALELRVYRRSDMVVAVSKSLKAILVEEGRLPEDRVLVVPNAVNAARFAPRERRRDVDAPVTVGFVGHVISWAGLQHLIDAAAVAARNGARIRLLIIGDGPDLPSLRDRASRARLSDVVEFTGRRPWSEIPELLARCDVAFSGQVPMAIGSMYHSPLKLYEYAAASLPVIATDFPDARALVEGSGAGWLIEPGDVDQLAKVLEELPEGAAELPERGAAARGFVLSHHTWTHRATSILEALASRGLLP